MENIAHTFFGLALAKAGLERSTPMATAALVISSNLPDIDVLTRVVGDQFSGLEHHRGITHSLIGLVPLSALLALSMIGADRLWRLRRDPFARPASPSRLFLLAYLGGLGHILLDFTNSYGVRPLLPFSDRWFYGDLIFIVDPWIWLILGFGLVLSARGPLKISLWIAIGTLQSLAVALAPGIPLAARLIWFMGLALAIAGAIRAHKGASLARWSLALLLAYYAGVWAVRDAVRQRTFGSLPSAEVYSVGLLPNPANPLSWKAVAAAPGSIFVGEAALSSITSETHIEWRRMDQLDPALAEALRRSRQGRIFLDFARYVAATVQKEDGRYRILLEDVRFTLRMEASLNQDLSVASAQMRWF
jgi:inner membrane protein